MAESSLTLDYASLLSATGERAGYGRDESEWTDDQSDRVAELVQTAYRRVLYPHLVPGLSAEHPWSWLRPTITETFWASVAVTTGVTVTGGAYDSSANTTVLTCTGDTPFFSNMVGKSIVITAVGTFTIASYTSTTVITVTGNASAAAAKTFSIAANGDYPLPDDFGEMVGNLTFATSAGYIGVQRTNEAAIREHRAGPLTTGIPQWYATHVRPSTPTSTEGQRWDVMIWPTPSSDRALTYMYLALPNALSDSNPYPLGGSVVSELIKASCFAAVEWDLNHTRGQAWEDFTSILASQIAHDRRKQADFHGYNGSGRGLVVGERIPTVTYNGAAF